MTKIITENFKTETTHALFDTLGTEDYYVVASTAVNATEFELDPTIQNTQKDKRDFQRKIIFGNRINQVDARYMFLENPWTRGTVYDQYDDSKDIESLNMIATIQDQAGGDYMVLKCLDNNNGAESQEIPGTIDSDNYRVVSTQDGYVWQYMFTVPASLAVRYRTATSLPLPSFTEFGGGYGHPDVYNRAREDISRIDITNSPVGQFNQYLFGPATSISDTSDVLTISSKQTANRGITEVLVSTTPVTGRTLYSEQNSYKNMYLRHNGSGKLYSVVSSETIENNIKLMVRTSEYENPDSFTPGSQEGGVQCQLVIKIRVTNSDIAGETCKAYGLLNESGTLTRIGFELLPLPVNTRGSKYKFATAEVVYPPFLKTSVQASGQETVLRAVVSPRGGHGSDPISEMAMSRLSMVASFSSQNNTIIPTTNTYSIVGLLKNPKITDENGNSLIPTDDSAHIFDNRLKIEVRGDVTGTVSANNYVEQYIETVDIQQLKNGSTYTIVSLGNMNAEDPTQWNDIGVPLTTTPAPGVVFTAQNIEGIQSGKQAVLAVARGEVNVNDSEYDYRLEVIKGKVHDVVYDPTNNLGIEGNTDGSTAIYVVDYYGDFQYKFQDGIFYIKQDESSTVSINSLDAIQITYGPYEAYSGDLLHFIDFTPIPREADKEEKIKFTFDF